MPQATGLVAELKARFGDDHKFELEPGERGIFDVKVNDSLVYSKDEKGRFPQYQEIPNKILTEGLNKA